MALDSLTAVTVPWWMHLLNATGSYFPWIIMTILFVLVIISIFGNIGIDWSSKKFTFGKKNNNDEIKRSCSDCIMLILGKRTIFESQYNNLQSNILRDQMVFAEHKIQEAKYKLLQSYQEDIEFFRQGESDISKENKEFIMYQEIISNALFVAKDEVRRSFKENGFHNLNDYDFKLYIKDRGQIIITIVRDYLRRTYPSGMTVSLNDRFKKMDGKNIFEMEEIITEVYINAKVVRTRIESEIKLLQDQFIEEMNILIGEKNA